MSVRWLVVLSVLCVCCGLRFSDHDIGKLGVVVGLVLLCLVLPFLA